MKLRRILMALVFFSVCIIGLDVSARSTAPETPILLEGGGIITAAQAEELSRQPNVAFFDMRSPVNFGKGHIPGASSLPYFQRSKKTPEFDGSLDQVDLSALPKDKKTRIVFYSHGTTGWKSYKAAILAIRLGHTNVLWLREGLSEWSANGYPVEH